MEKKIYYHDTDAGGVVYYGQYLTFLEEARTEFLEERGLDVRSMAQEGLLYVVGKCTTVYKSPARYGDTIVCRARIRELSAVRIVFEQTVRAKDSDKLLVEAEVVLVCVNTSFKPTQIPEHIRSKLL